MLDRLFLPALAVLAALMIGFAMIWPQGLGDRSPAPFGHTPVQQTVAMQAAMKREADASNRRLARQREAVTDPAADAPATTPPAPAAGPKAVGAKVVAPKMAAPQVVVPK